MKNEARRISSVMSYERKIASVCKSCCCVLGMEISQSRGTKLMHSEGIGGKAKMLHVLKIVVSPTILEIIYTLLILEFIIIQRSKKDRN